MKNTLTLLTTLFLFISCSSQNGKITSRTDFNWKDYPKLAKRISDNGKLKDKYNYLNQVKIEKITYLSDGLKVVGYIASPKNTTEKLPCVIYNRGGNKEFGKLNEYKAVFILAQMANWGYHVAASQYRGNDGGEGKEEFGGKDVNDILNLIPLFDNIKNADTSKMGIYGWSRGGMMTYLTLTKTNKFKAAIVGGAVSDLRMTMETRKDTFETVYIENIPNYLSNKSKALNLRSAVNQVENITKTTPILMFHGTSDWRVTPEQSISLSQKFIKHQIPHRLILFEGGDHGLREFNDEVDQMAKKWLEDYLKNGKALPDLKPHGK